MYYSASKGAASIMQTNGDDLDLKKKSSLISTSSWRAGEAIAKKQLRQHLAAQQEQLQQLQHGHPINTIEFELTSTAKKDQTHQSRINENNHDTSDSPSRKSKPKRTECQLIGSAAASSKSKSQNAQKTTSTSPSSKNKNKPYDLKDVHKYMQTQKAKRITEVKSEKEKQKKENEERRRKLQELYEKQKKQAALNNDIKRIVNPNEDQQPAKGINSNNIDSAKSRLNPKSSSYVEQDMSKVLMDKISYLLNDNDKLVDKQRQQQQQSSNKPKAHKFVSKRAGKRVEFDNENELVNKENNENSFDYSSSATLTPTHSASNNNNNNNEQGADPYYQETYTSHKNDRLKKICSMALDLQTKLQQTKLKLFGLNSNEEAYAAFSSKKSADENIGSSYFMASTKLEPNDDEYPETSEKQDKAAILFENSNRPKPNNPIEEYQINEDLEETDLPGVNRLAEFKPSHMSQDIAARKIQNAFRLYMMRKRGKTNKREMEREVDLRQAGAKKIKSQKVDPSPLAKPSDAADSYNFINIYKKRIKSDNLNVLTKSKPKHSEHHHHHHHHHHSLYGENYTEDFLSYQSAQANNNNINNSSIKKLVEKSSLTSSSSTSTNSTSIYKYMKIKKKSNSIQSKSSHKEPENNNDQVEMNEESLTEHSSSSNSSSSTSTVATSSSSSTATSSSGSNPPNFNFNSTKPFEVNAPVQPPPANTIKQPVLEPKPTNYGLKVGAMKSIRAGRADEQDPRYSPSSLERLFNAGINYLDILNSSTLQLEELDKVRCIGVAQQETVALAHLLKQQKANEAKKSSPADLIVEDKILKANKLKTMSVEASSRMQPKAHHASNKVRSLSLSSTLSSPSSENSSPKHKSASKNERHHHTTSAGVNGSETAAAAAAANAKKSYNYMTTDDEMNNDELEKSFRQLLPSESHIKKTKQESGGVGNQSILLNDMSSLFQHEFNSNQPSNVRLSFEDDSFKKFTGEIVKKYMQEEELRSKHQAHLLKLREKALIEKTDAELAWLEQLKKKVQDKGEDEKMPSILSKEKGIMQKLKEEQESINKMKEVQKKAAENRLKLLSQHSEVISWCQNKLKTQKSLKDSVAKEDKLESSYTEDFSTTEDDDQHNQLDESNINQSLIESKILKQVKQQLNSEKYLTEREKKLRLRRIHAEEIIAWKKKLDDEEYQVQEIEKKASQVLISAKKPAQSEANEAEKSATSKLAKSKTDDIEENIKTESKQRTTTDKSYSESFASTQSNKKTSASAPRIIASIQAQEVDESSIRSNYETKNDEISTNLIDKYETSVSESTSSSTATATAKDLEFKVKQLKEELLKKKSEAEKLRQTLKNKEKSKLKEKEEILRKKISSYDVLIDKIKTALDKEQDQQQAEQNKQQIDHEKSKSEEKTTTSSSREVKTEIKVDRKEKSQVTTTDIKTESIKDDYEDEIDQDKSSSISSATTPSSSSSSEKQIKTDIKLPSISNKKSIEEQISIRDDTVSSSSTSVSKKSSKQHKSLREAAEQPNKQYDDDFTQQSSTQQKSTSSLSKSKPKEDKLEAFYMSNNKKIDLDDEDEKTSKSTVSEISEEINVDVNSEDRSQLGKEKEGDESETSESSTDTQILLLGRSQKSESLPAPTAEQKPAVVPVETPREDKSDEKLKENLVENIQSVLVEEMIEQMLDVRRNKKIKEMEKSEQVVFDKGSDEEELDTSDFNKEPEMIEDEDDLLATTTGKHMIETSSFKIHIPSIDLSEEEANKQKELAKELAKEPVMNVPFTKEKIGALCDVAIESYFWKRLESNQSLLNTNESEGLELFFKSSMAADGDAKDSAAVELTFKQMLLDLIGELMNDLYMERFDKPQSVSEFLPGVKTSFKKQYFKSNPKGPSKQEDAKSLIKDRILRIFKLNGNEAEIQASRPKTAKSKWRSLKKLDLVDSLLDNEMREQEHDWANYEIEEHEAKLLITNTIFDMILKDTIECFQINFLKKQANN
jgi:hypothetical protein